ncbi:MAG: hypothetical protein OXF49_00160 [Candidatus Saccharibacteria bacterium]|nr:hypothetical protein [Candidatus Saccharibacteria bacterium]
MSNEPLFLPDYSQDPLREDIPEHMVNALRDWLEHFLSRSSCIKGIAGEHHYIKHFSLNLLQVELRLDHRLPDRLDQFCFQAISTLYPDLTFQIIAWAIKVYGQGRDQEIAILNVFLKKGGLAYEVKKIGDFYGFHRRVPEVVERASKEALTQNPSLNKAWHFCYAKNPNPKEASQQCCNFLEGFIRDQYFPNSHEPKFGDQVKTLRENPDYKKKFLANIKGSAVLQQKSETLLDLIVQFPNYRGVHTARPSRGNNPTQEQAEYILHTTIYFWNLHQTK